MERVSWAKSRLHKRKYSRPAALDHDAKINPIRNNRAKDTIVRQQLISQTTSYPKYEVVGRPSRACRRPVGTLALTQRREIFAVREQKRVQLRSEARNLLTF
jgi:hypothetical protein